MAKIPVGVGPKLPQIVVLFGATGDLAHKKLLPGLFHLVSAGFISKCRIIGVSLDALDAEGFRALARDAVFEQHAHHPKKEAWPAFEALLDYVPIAAGAGALKEAVDKAEKSFAEEAQRVHYMSVPPNAALSAIKMLSEAQLAGGSRVIMEKPFGTDLESAIALNDALHKVFAEDQIFRIDHFLGKEPAQNILAFRFGNGLFEPIWNRNFIDHVQIDVPETLDIGNRIGFYEQTGAYRDMVVTHLFQILGFMAMEPPTSLAPGPISEEKNKVFRSLMPIDPSHVVRGQFIGYRKEPGVDPESDTETFIALKCSHRQLALGGRAVLPADRQAYGRRPAHHFDRVPRAAEEHVPGRFRRWIARAGSPDVRSRRPVEGVAVVLRQEARPGHAARQAEPAIRDSRHRSRRRRARGLRASHPRRHARRSHAVLFGGGHRAAVGSLPAASRIAAAGQGLCAGHLGAAGDLSADRAPRVAVAVRAGLARRQCGERLTRAARGLR